MQEHETQLARLTELNAAMERDVQKMNERNRLMADVRRLSLTPLICLTLMLPRWMTGNWVRVGDVWAVACVYLVVACAINPSRREERGTGAEQRRLETWRALNSSLQFKVGFKRRVMGGGTFCVYVQIGDLKKKVPWLKFERAREKWEESRTLLKRVKEQIKERQAALAAAQAPVRERQAVKDEAEAARKKLKSASMKLDDKKNSLDDQIMTLVRACLSRGGDSACRRPPTSARKAVFLPVRMEHEEALLVIRTRCMHPADPA